MYQLTSYAIIIHIATAVLLLPVLLVKKNYASRALLLAICVNTIPFLFLPTDIGMDRLSDTRIPIVYFPMISCGTALMILGRGRIDRRDLGVAIAGGIFITYVFFVAVFKGLSFTTLQYILMWVFNLSLFLTVARFFSVFRQPETLKIFKELVWVIILAAAIGILKFLFGMGPDSNFMPLLNKGAVSFIIVGIWPLLFYLRDRLIIRNATFWAAQCLILVFFVMLANRSGLLGILFINTIYFMSGFKVQKLGIFALIITVAIAISASIGSEAFKKLVQVPILVQIVLTGEGSDNVREEYASSFDRIMLIKGAVEIIKNEFWFGSGIGLENYQRAFNEYFDFYRQTKPHNFYVSAFAEYGMIGYILLFCFLFAIYRRMPRFRSRNGVLFLSFLGIAFLLAMNEFIGMSELWFITGMLVGSNRQLN